MRKILAHIFLLIGISGCTNTPSTHEQRNIEANSQANSDISNGFIFENKSVIIANYFLTLAHSEKYLDETILEIFRSFPDLNNTLQQELNNNNTRELELRLYPVLDNKLTNEEMFKFIYFIRSESGKKLSTIAKVNNFDNTIKLIHSLPRDQFSDIELFLKSSYFKSTVDAFGSPEAQEILEKYGEDFICDFAIRNSFEIFNLLSAQQKCLTANDVHLRSRAM